MSFKTKRRVKDKKKLDELEDDNKLTEHLDELQIRVHALLHEYGPIWRFTTTSGRNVRQDVVTYSVAKALVEYVCEKTGKYAPEHVAIVIDDLCTLMNEESESDRMRRVGFKTKPGSTAGLFTYGAAISMNEHKCERDDAR